MSVFSTTASGVRTAKETARDLRDIEAPWATFAYLDEAQINHDAIPRRLALSKHGEPCLLRINSYKVDIDLRKLVMYQYRVDMHDGSEKEVELKRVKNAVWNCPSVQNGGLPEGADAWMYDGDGMAWSRHKSKKDGIFLSVDLNEEHGHGKSKPGSKQVVKLRIMPTKKVDVAPLQALLDGQDPTTIKTNSGPLGKKGVVGWAEVQNVLEHVLNQTARRNMVVIKKSFFNDATKFGPGSKDRVNLGTGAYACKGIYASFRPTLLDFSPDKKAKRSLTMNVDVSHACFWLHGELHTLLLQVVGILGRGRPATDGALQIAFQEVFDQWRSKGDSDTSAEGYARAAKFFFDSRIGSAFKRMRKLRCSYKHTSKANTEPKQYCIQGFLPLSVANCKFSKDGRDVSVRDYFASQYGVKNLNERLPVVLMTNGNLIPMELVYILPNQRYRSKLDEEETRKMMDFAVSLPSIRLSAITENVKQLNWSGDRFLKHFEIKVDNNPLVVSNARLLPSPTIRFSNGKIDSKTAQSGRWRIDGKKFTTPSGRKVTSWAVVVLNGYRGPAVSQQEASRFATEWSRTWASHGIIGFNTKPFMWEGKLDSRNPSAAFQEIYNGTGKQNNERIQFLFCIVGDRNLDNYRAVKRQCDLNWGIGSQVMQSKHIQKCQGQYLSNIALKVNGKLGGANTEIVPSVASKNFYTMGGVMVIGGDVSHPSPGAINMSSIASLSVSRDQKFNSYMARAETNGERVEIMTRDTIGHMFNSMIDHWHKQNQSACKTVLYIRDGVATAQYYKVITEEVRCLRERFVAYYKAKQRECQPPKFIAIVATKRHHIRFFPKNGDRNGNALPGTLVETGATEAQDLDWYLCSHVALKGTARPLHYTVILNEGQIPTDAIQGFIFEHAFQYLRATTPVSLHPAVYYADLAATRARLHEDPIPGMTQADTDGSWDKKAKTALTRLNTALETVMWYA